ASPGSSLGFPSMQQRSRIPSFSDVGDSAVVDDDEDTSLLRARHPVRMPQSRDSLTIEPVEGGDDHFAEYRGLAIPRTGDLYATVRRASRRPSILSEPGGPELLIKEVEDDAGNIIEVVVGQVAPPLLPF